MQSPSSQSAPARACTRRAAYGAPDAPVMPRKMRTEDSMLGPFRGLEERCELLQVRLAERSEDRHRRALVDAARALQVRDLECDPLSLRALGAQVRRTELRAADAEIGVAGRAAGLGEEPRTGHGRLVAREALLLRPARHRGEHLAGERLVRG